MSINDLKPRFQELLRPLTKTLADNSITANQVTIAALAISVVTGAAVLSVGELHPTIFLLLPIVLLIRMALNAIDGMLAREYDMKSKLGAVLNEVGDVLSDVALYISFIKYSSPTVLILTLLFAALTEYIGVLGGMTGSGRQYQGPMGKSDRAVAFGGLALLLALGPINTGAINCILIVISLLLIRTCQNRVHAAIK